MSRLFRAFALALAVALPILSILVGVRRQELLFHASVRGTMPVLKSMLWIGADPGVTCIGGYPLYAAAWNGQVEAADYLLSHGAPVDSKETSGATPLMGAATQGHDAVVRTLAAHGANLQASCARGNALDLARAAGHASTVQVLTAAGARPTR